MNKNKKYFLEKLGNRLYHWFLALAILGLILALGSQSFLNDFLQSLVQYHVPLCNYIVDGVMFFGIILIGIGGGVGLIGSTLYDYPDAQPKLTVWSIWFALGSLLVSLLLIYLLYQYPHYSLPLGFLALICLLVPLAALITILIINHFAKKK